MFVESFHPCLYSIYWLIYVHLFSFLTLVVLFYVHVIFHVKIFSLKTLLGFVYYLIVVTIAVIKFNTYTYVLFTAYLLFITSCSFPGI